MAQPIEPKSRDVSTQASLLIADPREANRLEQPADKVIRVGKKTTSCKEDRFPSLPVQLDQVCPPVCLFFDTVLFR